MKRGKRHGIERELCIKRIRSQKKYSILIVSVLLLACILIQFGFQMAEGLRAAYTENRKAVYGEWEKVFLDVDTKSEEVAGKNPFLAQIGKVEIYGSIAGDYVENRQMNIGTIDQTAWQLGRLELKEGHLPENEHEIAMEYSTLLSLGYEKMLGKEIKISIVPQLSVLDEPDSVSCTYTLCGIVKDYQVNWEICNRNRFPTGIVTEEGAKQIGNRQTLQMLTKAKNGSGRVYEDLKKSEEFTCAMEDNSNQGVLLDKNIPYMDFLKNIRLLIGGAAVSILFLTVSRSVMARDQFWRFLDALGMEKRQMYQIIIWEGIIFGIGATLIGSITGIVLYQISIPVFEKVTKQSLPQQISWQGVFAGICFCGCCIGISYGLAAGQLRDLFRTKKKKVQKRKKGMYLSKFTPSAILLHKWRTNRVRKSAEIILLASILLVIGFGKTEILTKESELETFRRMTGNGYYLDTISAENSPGIAKKTVEKLEQVAGVESVERYHNNDKKIFWVDLSAYAESPYFQKVVKTERNYLEDANVEQISLHLLTVENWQDFQRFRKNLAEGELTKKEFERGDYCILVLPPLKKIGEDFLGVSTAGEIDKDCVEENLVQVGNEFPVHTLSADGSTVERKVPVTAILRTSKEEDVRSPYPAGSGIYMIVGENFWREFKSSTVMDFCQEVKILVSEDADMYNTEEHILSVLKQGTTVEVQNYHAEYKTRCRELYSFIGMYSIFAVFYMILISIVLYQMFLTEKQEEKREWKILQSLGMEKKFEQKMHRIEILWMMGSAAVIGELCLWAFKNLNQ